MNFHQFLVATCIIVPLQCVCFLDVNGADTTLVYRICNGQRSSAAFFVHKMETISHLIKNTPDTGYDYYYIFYDAYGHAACNGKITKEDCTSCLKSARDQDCTPGRVGAQIQLQDCRIRYENYPFVEV